jgi:signal transduction histidine kinase
MKIRDNGKGFQKERVLSARRGQRLGLLGMRERLDMVGGKFTVTSRPGKGTTVLAQVPLMNPLPGGEKDPLIA